MFREELGLYHLKHALEARGLKCGGSLQERAVRLFTVKGTVVTRKLVIANWHFFLISYGVAGLKKEDYPKAIVAPPPKNKK